MKYRYRFHPYEYALGENEKFYSDMEAKGWRLVERGGYLSKFAPAEPSRARYRIEVASQGFLEGGSTMPPEQRTVYEDCGWEYIAGRNLLHIFRAPEDSGAPEFYADPAEQAATLKALRRQAVLSWIPPVAVLLCNLAFSHYSGGLQKELSIYYRGILEQTAIMTAVLLIILSALYSMFRGMWQINRTYRRLKRGIPLDHNPRGWLVQRSVNSVVLTLICLCAALAVPQWVRTMSRDLPEQADGPYLLLRDLGWDMERRVPCNSGDKESGITHTSSLLADYWDVYETIGDEHTNFWMYQDIYRLRSPKMARSLANALRNTTTFGRSADDCTCYVMGDMTAWLYRDLELVAVSGNMAAHITYMDGGWNEPDLEPLLAALRERWEEW